MILARRNGFSSRGYLRASVERAKLKSVSGARFHIVTTLRHRYDASRRNVPADASRRAIRESHVCLATDEPAPSPLVCRPFYLPTRLMPGKPLSLPRLKNVPLPPLDRRPGRVVSYTASPARAPARPGGTPESTEQKPISLSVEELE